ncbi:MAG TPA: MFS transporter [Pyrinomonadaceae bacterium]|nr:MFS transporter [Pyrinomonadaceae bacterium]
METAADLTVNTGTKAKTGAYAWYALGLLATVNLLNYLDRTLIYILFAPIKKEMSFTDFELALLGATSFVILFTLLGVPFGRLADRSSRKNMIAAGLTVWSLFSGLTGFANGFWSLFLYRVMVGVGEATLAPAALSLLGDYFPPQKRASVQSIYASGITIGSGLAFFLGGWIGLKYGWRTAFYFLGFPGLFFAVLVFLLKEQKRGRTEVTTPKYTSEDWKLLFQSRPLRYHYAGYAFFAVAANSLSIWGPTFFTRVHGYSIATLGIVAGLTSLTFGISGTVLGGFLSDRLRRGRRGGRMRLGATAAIFAIPFWIVLLFSYSVPLLLVSQAILLSLSLVWIASSMADVHEMTGPHLRGLGAGVFLCVVQIAAYGIGSPLIGKLNDLLGAATNPGMMRYGFLISPISCIFAAILLWRGSKVLEKIRE